MTSNLGYCARILVGGLSMALACLASSGAMAQQSATTYPVEVAPRFALLIGNKTYDGEDQEPLPDLANPCNDIELIAAQLIRSGWNEDDIVTQCNADDTTTDNLLKAFVSRLRVSDRATALIYLSGHGAQIDDEAYVFSAKAKPDVAQEAAIYTKDNKAPLFYGSALNVSDFFSQRLGGLLATRKGALLVVLDACRNNPLIDEISRSANGARVSAPTRIRNRPHGMMMAFSTKNGLTASDGIGANSPFAAALAEAIEARGDDDFDVVINRTVDTVLGETKGTTYEQEPDKDGTMPEPKRCFRPCAVGGTTTTNTSSEVGSGRSSLPRLARLLVSPKAEQSFPPSTDPPPPVRVLYEAPRPAKDDPQARRPTATLDVSWCAGDELESSRRLAATEFAASAATYARYFDGDGPRVTLVRLGPLPLDVNQTSAYRMAGNLLLYDESDTETTRLAAQFAQVSPTTPLRAVAAPDSSRGLIRVFLCSDVNFDRRPAQVFVQYAAPEQDVGVRKLIADLRRGVDGIDVVSDAELNPENSPETADVRYYFQSDEWAARRIAQAASASLGTRVMPRFFEKYARKPRPGTIEVWIGKATVLRGLLPEPPPP